MEKLFDHIDADRDGVLAPEELGRFVWGRGVAGNSPAVPAADQGVPTPTKVFLRCISRAGVTPDALPGLHPQVSTHNAGCAAPPHRRQCHSPPGPSWMRASLPRVVASQQVVSIIEPGTVVPVLEVMRGTTPSEDRVRTSLGWISVVSSSGIVLFSLHNNSDNKEGATATAAATRSRATASEDEGSTSSRARSRKVSGQRARGVPLTSAPRNAAASPDPRAATTRGEPQGRFTPVHGLCAGPQHTTQQPDTPTRAEARRQQKERQLVAVRTSQPPRVVLQKRATATAAYPSRRDVGLRAGCAARRHVAAPLADQPAARTPALAVRPVGQVAAKELQAAVARWRQDHAGVDAGPALVAAAPAQPSGRVHTTSAVRTSAEARPQRWPAPRARRCIPSPALVKE